jgi:hypothetical protein
MTEAVKSDRKTLIESLLAEPVLARLATTNPQTMQPHGMVHVGWGVGLDQQLRQHTQDTRAEA